MQKRYYKVGEFVWLVAEKTKAKVMSLDIPNLSLRVSVRQEDGSFHEKTVKFMEVDKLKSPATRENQTPKLDTVLWAKVREDAIVPTKDEENAGYDVYANFEQDYIMIHPHTVELIPTGIAMSLKDDYVFLLEERGSTGSKGMSKRAGVIDSSFRGEIFVAINNTQSNPIIIAKKGKMPTVPANTVIYPYEKAIAQGLILPVPKLNHKTIPYEDLLKIPSKRGVGKLGNSGK